jgi:hypothetical protein
MTRSQPGAGGLYESTVPPQKLCPVSFQLQLFPWTRSVVNRLICSGLFVPVQPTRVLDLAPGLAWSRLFLFFLLQRRIE